MTDLARTGIFAVLLFASARSRFGMVRPSSPMPPTFRRWRRVMRLCAKPQQANVLDEFMLASQNEFLRIQQSPGQIFEHGPPVFGSVKQRGRLLQLSPARRAAQCGPIKFLD